MTPNAFAGQPGQAAAALPPGYAYFYGQGPQIPGLAAAAAAGYGSPGVYPAAAMTAPTTASTQQFQQKNAYGSNYGSYDALGGGGVGSNSASNSGSGGGNKDFGASNYSNNKSGSSSGKGNVYDRVCPIWACTVQSSLDIENRFLDVNRIHFYLES